MSKLRLYKYPLTENFGSIFYFFFLLEHNSVLQNEH